MQTQFKTKVALKEDLKKILIFGIEARLPIGLILGFYGYRHEVMPLMQNLSHGTRAYICNAEGLPGFVIWFDVIYEMKLAMKNIPEISKWQKIDASLLKKVNIDKPVA